jgi:hypothetical protein
MGFWDSDVWLNRNIQQFQDTRLLIGGSGNVAPRSPKKGGKDDLKSRHRKPFDESLAGGARPVRSDQPPEASLAWRWATISGITPPSKDAAKRRQRVRKPCY